MHISRDFSEPTFHIESDFHIPLTVLAARANLSTPSKMSLDDVEFKKLLHEVDDIMMNTQTIRSAAEFQDSVQTFGMYRNPDLDEVFPGLYVGGRLVAFIHLRLIPFNLCLIFH